MANMNKLKGKIIENGLSVDTLAEKIGVNRTTLYRKIAENGRNFTVLEADCIRRILGLTTDEALEIFFNHNVA